MSKSKKEGVTVAEIWLPCAVGKLNKENAPSFVHEKGTSPYYNLQQLALAVSCHRPVLLQGPVGSGKTSTVEYLAYLTGHRSPLEECKSDSPLFLKVQLGEQTDARVLLGGYQCTEIPGQFIWKPGVLTQAVLKGYWLLLEDIDCTSSDVVTVIDNLVKTQSLCVSGYSDNIIPHSDFQLFATQRTLRYESSSGVKTNILKHWITIQLNPLSNSEIIQIINKKYPKLSSIASRMVGVLDLEFATNETNIRVPSARDILKWCRRCHNYFETGSPESALRIFHDAVDIFCGFLDKELRFAVGAQIGFKLGIVKNKANFLNGFYRPNVLISTDKFIAGRCCLERREDSVVVMNRIKRNVFSLTTQSCCLIEKISCCLQYNEPVLLVGETGCGKTTVLQYIANILGRTLVVINMNQQSDTADLVGGFKPVTFKWIMKPLCDKFETLFRSIFDPNKNAECLNKFSKLVKKQDWDVLIKFIIHVQKKSLAHINSKLKNSRGNKKLEVDDEDSSKWEKCLADWQELGTSVEKYSKQLKAAEKSLVFSFIEGSLIKAMKEGHWVLLDEINLANSETLDCLSGLLEDSRGSILLLEKGESKPVYRDAGFRLFAAMNPATDVGKKQLPVGLRNRFTELYIDELEDTNDLLPLVEAYLNELNQIPAKLMKIVKFYLTVKKDSKTVYLDGNGKKPHYSLRNLCRALMITAKNACGNVPRSLYEGLSISFLTQLDMASYKSVKDLIIQTVTESDVKALLNQPIPKPCEGRHINLEGFWVPLGSLEPSTPDNYILTPTVQRHLRDLIRIVSLGSGIPVLLEGDTSVGKTSLINYLAKCSGNVCSRVNNHEHTDIQEYIGTYVADAQGKLVFKEGILCESMRKGHWLILDELNLAPTEVLEALNRVLDDNRELFIPETQKTIKAHERFLLFATQNPPGLYGGRKELSRAFRNRFIELQFNQIPAEELVTILEKRCQIPLSYSKKMVGVMTDLQLRRRGSDIFIGKSGFITLRDLFRWGERYQKAKVESRFHDWEQHIADEGYILLAGRVRLQEESRVIEEVICKYFKRKTNPENLFSLHENTSEVTKNILEKLINHSVKDDDFKHIVWTYSMRRLAVLVSKALEFSEPVLIVGETGCGKTSVVQLLAKMKQQELYSVNCHMHSESADFLGGLRPVRNESKNSGKFFEWCDGPLVQAMTTGSFFLADEISLADDSVLERLNSLLEPERTILLAEKGGGLIENENEEYVTVADKNFQFIGTMNPGGDYGKKELSPALRNRFTEIWAETSFNKFECYCEIIKHNLKVVSGLESRVAEVMTRFLKWFQDTETGKRVTISARDVMTWVNFVNASDLDWHESCVHGVYLTFLDGLGSGSGFTGNVDFLKRFKHECVNYLTKELSQLVPNCEFVGKFFENFGQFYSDDEKVGIHPFYIKKGKWDTDKDTYVFNAPTTFANTKRLLRGLRTKKAILLEGSPGVGKTSLVTALAKAAGYKLARINFSDQTDISDLFGADLPEEGGMAGHFVWRDGPFLTALKEGQWILLDELNLASQSVLEGLNAVLDHRGSVYIPELNKTFYISTETRLFGCQNPLKEGGNRRGLPKSFLNRFTQVFVETLTENDYVIILNEIFPVLSLLKIKNEFVINQMVKFTGKICEGIALGQIGLVGGPWELNLRDITRWAEGIVDDMKSGKECEKEEEKTRLSRTLYKHMKVLYLQRFRTKKDREIVYDIYVSFFGETESVKEKPQFYLTKNVLVMGENATKVKDSYFYGDMNEFEMFADSDNACKFVENGGEGTEILKLCSSYRGKRKMEDLRVLEKQYPVLSSLCQCVNRNWLAILIGESGTGKTNCVRTLAALKGENLRIMCCNSAMDTTEILGGFEQTDYNRHFDGFTEAARIIVLSAAKRHLEQGKAKITVSLLKKWLEFRNLPLNNDSLSATAAFELFLTRLEFLEKLLRNGDLKKDEDLRKRNKALVGELQELKRNLSTSDCLTFGGKFEWVDSILVKALKDGSWLLMEDVNLCSNAVLDRLNCLLEPNGVLTIGERGTDTDGKSITVKPHPNFRLFFTMDPRNGPISRAMRNRGVEIYLLRDEDITNWPRLDVLSLLTDAGIPDLETQRALIELESSCDYQNISTLTSNGFWTAQYRRHGFGKPKAFEKASKHVYRSSGDETFRLIEELSNKLTEDKQFTMAFARPSLNNFIIDPRYARSKQCCALFHFLTDVIKNYSRARERGNGNEEIPAEALEYFFGSERPVERLSVADIAAFNVLHIYLTVSKEGVDMLKVRLEEFGKEGNLLKRKGLLVKLSQKLSDIVPESDSNNFPWDSRWFEGIHRLFGSRTGSELNKMLVLMKYIFYLSLEKDLDETKEITVTKYSKSVREGRLEDAFPNQPIVSKFLSFIKDFDDLTVETLNCDTVKVTEDDAKWFLDVMKWRFRLGRQGNLILVSGGSNKCWNEDVLTLLELHLSWFLDFVVRRNNRKSLAVFETLPETLRQKYTQYSATSEKIVSSENSSKLIKMSNVFRNSLGHPSPTKYLPRNRLESEMSAMEITQSDGFLGDPIILRDILNSLIEYVNLKTNSWPNGKDVSECQDLATFLSLLNGLQNEVKHALPLKDLLEEFYSSNWKEKQKMASEMTFFSLKILNFHYEFAEEVNETSENLYLHQVLPFHRPVWTSRVLQVVFNADSLWNLSSYAKSQEELWTLLVTILPNTSTTSSMNRFSNDKSRLSLEINRVLKSMKKCLGIESDDRGLKEVLSEMSEKSHFGVEKIFYTRLNTIVSSFLGLNVSQDSDFNVTGCYWSLLGLLELLILREGKIDPIRKKLIKANYVMAEVTELETETTALELYSAITGISRNHFYARDLKDRLNGSRESLAKYSHLENVERNPESFRELSKEMESFMTTFDEIYRFCGNVLEKGLRGRDDQFGQHLYRKGRFIVLRNKKFAETLEKRFVTHFADLVYPILSASSQIEHGMNVLMSELLRRPFSHNNEVSLFVSELGRYPITTKIDLLSKFQKLNVGSWPKEALNKIESNKLLILFSCCLTKVNEWLLIKSNSNYDQVMGVFSLIVEFWKKEEERKEKEEMEKESLYMKKGVEKCKTTPEDEEFLQDQMKLFPTFEDDFEENSSGKACDKPKTDIRSLTFDHFSQVSKMHMEMVKQFVQTRWSPNRSLALTPDFVSPIRMRFVLLSRIIPNISYLLDHEHDRTFLPGLLVLMHCKQTGSCSTDARLFTEKDPIYDFYRDKNVEEVGKCLEILKGLKKKLDELLNEWPEHPTLVQINVIIDRILGFPVDSPVMRFLTGLEYLLQSCQHWESVAHSGVSIADHLINITNLIIEWRRLELQGWRNCLQAAHERLKNEAFKWWFHFWCLLEEYLKKNEESSLEDLLKALYNFIETSPAGEFQTRLEILISYHYHLLHLPRSKQRDTLVISLWNLYSFYQQFKGDVNKKLKDESGPIFRKLKEFVGIAKWHDITYWSVKQAIEKSHRTLLKFVKEYEVILKRKVELNQFDPTRNDETKKKKSPKNVNIMRYLKDVERCDVEMTESISGLKNLKRKLEKATKFSNDVILKAEYPNLILSLEGLSEEICETTQHFANLDVDRTLSQEKQKAQAKNIVHQKRRALADLFKTLSKIGLSYRAGLRERSFEILNLCDSPPADFNERTSDSRNSGEAYYLKSIFRKLVLENSLLTPSKEIGPPVIERLRGFSGHFMKINKKQKVNLVEGTVALDQLQKFEKALTSLTKAAGGSIIPNQKRFSQKVKKMREILGETCYVLRQFVHVLDSWPLTGSERMKKMNFLTGALTPDLLMSSKSDQAYSSARGKLDEILTNLSNLNRTFDENLTREMDFDVRISKESTEIFRDEFFFYNSANLKAYEKSVEEFKRLVNCLTEFREFFSNESVSGHLDGCLLYVEQLSHDCENYVLRESLSDVERTRFEKVLTTQVGTVIEDVLLAIQRLVKKYMANRSETKDDGTENNENENEGGEEEEEEEDEGNELLDNHFDQKLVECLHSDVKDLCMDRVNEGLSSIFNYLSSFSESSDLVSGGETCLRILSTILPFVRQYSTLCSYFVDQLRFCYRTSNKLSSILFGTFIQVAQKGYCLPPEYEEDGDGEGWSEKEGGGFTGGEGEGQKDVSDRIESEDQLEDARPQSEKDKEQEKDCKEEEKGIEMSENFDGKTQDLEKKDEDDDHDVDDDEEEPDDKEMGETEAGADKLESQMWSDSENEEEDNTEKKEEEGKGEQINKDKYAAKDEENEGEGKDDEGNDKERKEKQKEINEMEEPEDNGDQVDPYHGKHEPELEPEPLDLPEDMQLDDAEMKDDENAQEENPFDIDAMKECQPPTEMEEDEEDKENKEKTEEEVESDYDDEGKEAGDTKAEKMDVDEDEETEEDGEKKNEGEDETMKDEEKKQEDDELTNKDDFQPSDDRPSEMAAQPAPETKRDEMSSADQVVGGEEMKQNEFQAQEVPQNSEMEPKGVGSAEIEQTKQGHDANTSKKEKLKSGQSLKERERKRERPGKSDEDRCLGNEESRVSKKLKTLDKTENKEEEKEEEKGVDNDESDLYQHVSEKVQEASQILDAATKEQAQNQSIPNKEEEENMEEPTNEDDVAMDVDEEEPEVDGIDKRKPSEVEKTKNFNKNTENEGDALGEDVKNQMEGDVIETMKVERGPETTFHTQLSALNQERSFPLQPDEIKALRLEIQEQLSKFNQNKTSTSKSAEAWHLLTSVVDGLARDLSEQLRLILEPTRATRLKGDYRTGRRINMRKVINYIASEFRKDNIWLRRTKPWKREHEIVLAIDDSSSMSHNESKELAFESLALVFKALGLIEAGQLGVLSFGEKTKIVHRPGDPFSDDTGARILEEFTFEQKKTLVCEMLDVSTSLMTQEKKKEEVARLLLIISDGRGVFSEGLDRVKTAVRRATDSGIFVVFVIIDNPRSKNSIMDIRMPEFKDGKFLGIKSYMELFPFPYYLILRDIVALPNTLSDALRQWFQLVVTQ